MNKNNNSYQGSYERQAMYYDAIYESQGKDYKKESEQIHEVIKKHKKSSGTKLLDVGCGTGGHFSYLKDWYSVEGLDIDENMLGVSRKRFPGISFHQGSMVDFHLHGQYDVITCLFSAIGYTKTVGAMRQSVVTMSQHLITGGVLVVEPWFAPDKWNVGMVHSVFVDKPDLKIARINTSERDGDVSIINFHFLVGSQGKVEHFTELHELGLFTLEQYTLAFKDAGLETIVDSVGITGRGLFIGVKR